MCKPRTFMAIALSVNSDLTWTFVYCRDMPRRGISRHQNHRSYTQEEKA